VWTCTKRTQGAPKFPRLIPPRGNLSLGGPPKAQNVCPEWCYSHTRCVENSLFPKNRGENALRPKGPLIFTPLFPKKHLLVKSPPGKPWGTQNYGPPKFPGKLCFGPSPKVVPQITPKMEKFLKPPPRKNVETCPNPGGKILNLRPILPLGGEKVQIAAQCLAESPPVFVFPPRGFLKRATTRPGPCDTPKCWTVTPGPELESQVGLTWNTGPDT